MKRTILVTMILVFLTTLTFAENKCENVNMRWLRSHVNLPQKSFIEEKNLQSEMCQIILNINERFIPLYADIERKFVISGQLYSKHKRITNDKIDSIKKKVSKLRQSEFIKVKKDFDSIASFTYTPKNPTGEELYFITDPNCGYCKKAGKDMKKIAEKQGITIKTIIVSMLNGSRNKATEAICKKVSFDQYISNWKYSKSNKFLCKDGLNKIKKSNKIAKNWIKQGVPVFIKSNGEELVGYNPSKLLKMLERKEEVVNR
ncbi:MAG: thioredoxin fold domain-containing protein [Desulfobacterales bacterium]|nr:thioredoxin fold domain-containing protein [Desulfobacterales bacterium]